MIVLEVVLEHTKQNTDEQRFHSLLLMRDEDGQIA